MRFVLTTTLAVLMLQAPVSAGDASNSGPSTPSSSTTVVVDASAFLDAIPLHDSLIDGPSSLGRAEPSRGGAPRAGQQPPADSLPGSHLFFNGYGIIFNAEANLHTVQELPESGTYHLYVRSQGAGRSSFRVSVNDQLSPATFGNTPALALVKGGTFELGRGSARILLTRIWRGATFDALFLSKNPDLKESDLPALQFSADAVLLKEYDTGRGTPKFGDVDGDGRMDVLSVAVGGAASVYNHDGRKLWTWEPPGAAAGERLAFAGFEAPGLIWDLDQDGRGEVIHWRLDGGTEKLVVADGLTGAVKFSTDWPAPPAPHEYYNFRLSIANFTGGHPSDIVVFTDSGNDHKSVAAFTADLKPRWNHVEKLRKDHLGHYAYPVDVDGDRIDEVFVSALALDAKGRKLWDRFDRFYDNHDHFDSFRFADINGDGRTELLCPASDMGVIVLDALTGRVHWQRPAEHAQQLEWGSFLAGRPAPQLAVNGRFYANGQSGRISALVHWFDADGNRLKSWPSRPLNGNPDFVKGDWRGDGTEVLFWHQFRMKPDGTGELYLPDTAVFMFDFDGNGTDDVITRGGAGVRVYTYRHGVAQPQRVIRDPDVLRRKVANLTHY